MKLYSTLLIIGICFYSQLCQGQACQSIQRIRAKDGSIYIGVVNLPKSGNVTSNHLFKLMLAKSINKADTTYQLSLGMNATGVAGKASPIGILLQFEDGSQISKPGQSVEVMPLTYEHIMLSAEVILTIDELRQLKNKSLTDITLSSNEAHVADGSLKELASCLLITW